MKKLLHVRMKLRDTAKHPEISYKTGVSIRTLYNVLDESKTVKDSTIEKLYLYFKGKK
jgi:hypothetical protein